MFHPSGHDIEMKEEEFRLLRDFVHERFGLYFGDNQRGSLRARLAGRVASLDLGSFEDYFHYLRFGPDHAAELDRVASYLTNNETYFYREKPQLEVFADILKSVKERKARTGDRGLRILSAGCSSGEEAYTLAMVVYDSGQFFWGWDVRITGLDVDAPALEKARRATYHRNSFRSIPPALVDRHFVKTPAGLVVKDPIRRLVSFRPGNLVDPAAYEGLVPLDAIFCRNVLIYFSDAMIRRVAALFHDALAPGGHLFLGHAESLSRITDRFVPIRFQGAMAYRKGDAAGGAAVIRVLIVDDSAFVRQALTRMLASDPEIEVVAAAADGAEGVAKIKELRPDVVTLDVKMPRVDGLEALRRIMTECPTPVLLLSSHTSEGADVTLRGLELGAMDFVDKTSVQGHMNLLGLSHELREKVRALAGVPRDRVGLQPRPWPDRRPARRRGKSAHIAEIVVIGTSTGGPPALQAIIPRLPKALASPVLVVQHMPVGFTRSLAERLAARSEIAVREAEDGERLAAGSVLIAPAGRHMKVRRRGAAVTVWLDDEPRSALHRPSVDVLMTSVARTFGERSLGIILTGMGSDGVEGMRALREAGGRTLAESEETSVIYGMPKAAVEAGVVDASVPLGRMADEILAAV